MRSSTVVIHSMFPLQSVSIAQNSVRCVDHLVDAQGISITDPTGGAFFGGTLVKGASGDKYVMCPWEQNSMGVVDTATDTVAVVGLPRVRLPDFPEGWGEDYSSKWQEGLLAPNHGYRIR